MVVREDFGVMFRDHHKMVYGTAYRITGSASDAEDVLQTLFLRLLQADSKRDLQPNPKAYLRRASVNISLDILRSRKIQVPVEDAVPVEDHAIRANEIQELLRTALKGLSPKLAEMFVLKHIEGYDNAELASMFGTSTGTVAVLLFRARTQIRKSLIGAIS